MDTFDQWLAASGFDAAALTESQRTALQAAYDAQRPPAKGNEHGTPATAAEVAAILAKYDAGNPEVVAATRGAQAIGATARQTELAALLASRGTGAPNFIGTGRARGGDDGGTEFLEAALLVKAGHERLAENVLGGRTLEMSKRLHAMSMVDLCKESLRLSGRTAPHGRSEMLQAALSTTAMPVALGNVMNKIAEATYKLAPATWRSWCAVRSAANFHDHKGLRPSFAFGLEELAPGGDVAHGSVGEEVYTWAVDTYAKQIAIDRRDLINDDASVLADLIPSLAKAAGRSLSNLIFRTLLANAGNHFAAGNANYASGGGSALGTTALAAAVQKLRRQVDDDGNNLDLTPTVLLVPPELEVTARGLLQSAEIARSTASDGLLPTGNTFQNLAKLEVESRLSNSAFTGYSTTAWYLFASPMDVPMIVGFLDGNEIPTVTTFGFDADPNKLAMTWRIHFDYGAALADPRAGVLSTGA